MATVVGRDYSLVGPEAQAAENGARLRAMVRPPVPRKELKELMSARTGRRSATRRSGSPRSIVSGGLGYHFWGSWAASRSSRSTACSTAPRRTAAGMNAATAPRSRRAG